MRQPGREVVVTMEAGATHSAGRSKDCCSTGTPQTRDRYEPRRCCTPRCTSRRRTFIVATFTNPVVRMARTGSRAVGAAVFGCQRQVDTQTT
jgi:hypothetical protein